MRLPRAALFVSGALPKSGRHLPLHGLRISRCRGESASPAASEGQESRLREAQVIKYLSVFVLHP